MAWEYIKKVLDDIILTKGFTAMNLLNLLEVVNRRWFEIRRDILKETDIRSKYLLKDKNWKEDD